jgi:uncharacterized protein YegP (UPF0339 family)
MATRPYPSFLIYLDSKGEYRWRYQASNYKTIADSGEGYTTYKACEHGINLVKQSSSSDVWHTQEAAEKQKKTG